MSLSRIVADNFPVSPTKTVLIGNGTTTVFTIAGSTGLVNPNELIVSLDGAIQEPTVDYTVNNNTITFTTAPDNGAKVVVVYRNSPYVIDSVIPTDGAVTNVKLAANSVTPDKLSIGGPFWNSSSNVALGHSTPVTNLHINYSNYAAIQFGNNIANVGFHITKESSDNSFNIWSGAIGSGVNRFKINSSGNLGIRNANPKTELDVDGTISFGRRINNGGAYPAAGYLSNVWTGADGYRFFTLGSTYFDGTSWITNKDATLGSNAVSEIIGDVSGIGFYTNVSNGNTQRTDTKSTFETYERMRIRTDGSLDLKGNAILNTQGIPKAAIYFCGSTVGDSAIAPTAASITTQAGSNLGIWNGAGWSQKYLGLTYYMNVSNAYNSLGGIPAVPGKGVYAKVIEIISSTQARVQYLQPATSSVTLVGTGTTAGFIWSTDGILGSYGISSISRIAAGKYQINFSTAFSSINYYFVAGQTYNATETGWNIVEDERLGIRTTSRIFIGTWASSYDDSVRIGINFYDPID